MTVGFVAGDTVLHGYVYLLILAFGVWVLMVLGLTVIAVGRWARRRLRDRRATVGLPGRVAQ